MKIEIGRRNFLRGLAGVSALGAGGCFSIGGCDSDRIRLACVGVMGQGYSDWLPMLRSGLVKIVAFCDCDYNTREEAQRRLIRDGVDFDMYSVPFYTDYRRLLDDAGILDIEAMTVSTTDHTHAPIAIRAMQLGLHVFVQKPLVRTLWELKYFNDTAEDYGVVTQMGNQGSALSGFRRGVRVLASGILGDVAQVHVWTNRPVWPQGKDATDAILGKADRVPDGVNWNTWLATAKDRPYKNAYLPFRWRGYYDFGCGAFGDMACHTMNLPFRGLELGRVTKAVLKSVGDRTDAAYPMKSVVELTYAARDSRVRPGVRLPEATLTWYDGGNRPPADLMPQVVAAQGKVPDSGCLVIGSKGILCSTHDYGAESFLALGDEKAVVNVKDHPACRDIASDAAAPGDSTEGHYIEFLRTIRGEASVHASTGSGCFSDVGFSIPMMEGILVGCIAQRVCGPDESLAWDSALQKFDRADANLLLKPSIRKGFEF